MTLATSASLAKLTRWHNAATSDFRTVDPANRRPSVDRDRQNRMQKTSIARIQRTLQNDIDQGWRERRHARLQAPCHSDDELSGAVHCRQTDTLLEDVDQDLHNLGALISVRRRHRRPRLIRMGLTRGAIASSTCWLHDSMAVEMGDDFDNDRRTSSNCSFVTFIVAVWNMA